MHNINDLLFLVPLFTVGIISTFNDIRYGKIKNLWIGIGLIFTLIVYAAFFIIAIIELPEKHNLKYMIDMIVNGLIAGGVSFFMWKSNLWGAGDAKLITLFSFLLPLKFYSNSYVDFFPAFNIFINTFILIIVFILLEYFLFILKNHNRFKKISFSFIKKENLLGLLNMFLIYLVIFISIRLLINHMESSLVNYFSPSNFAAIMLLLFVVNRFLFKFLLKNKIIMTMIIAYVIFYITYLMINGQTSILLYTLKTALIYMISIRILITLLNQYLSDKEIKQINILELKENMMVPKNEIEKLNNLLKEKKIDDTNSHKLTFKEILYIKKYFKEKDITKINISQFFPFAPFMTAACLITILVRGSVITYFLGLF